MTLPTSQIDSTPSRAEVRKVSIQHICRHETDNLLCIFGQILKWADQEVIDDQSV
jgi:hypothetical protein